MSVYPGQVFHQKKTHFIDLEMHGISRVFTSAGSRHEQLGLQTNSCYNQTTSIVALC